MARIERPLRRSEDVRQRRESQPRKTVPPAVRRSQHSLDVAPPPVMVRTTSRPAMGREARRPNGRGKRRYDVPLDMPGVEIRLPSLPQVHLGWRVLSACLVIVLAFSLYYAWNSADFRVGEVSVTGLQRLSDKDVNAVLGVKNQPVFLLDPNIMEQELLGAFPEFQAVTATLELPATVAVTVTERAPVMVWRQDGRTELVDIQGMSFPVREAGDETGLPVIEAQAPPPLLEPPQKVDSDKALEDAASQPDEAVTTTGAKALLSPQMVAAVLALAERAPQNTTIIYDELHGFGWKDERGWDVYFGDAADMEMKLLVYKALVKRLKDQVDQEDQEGQPSLISVEYVHAPYYRVER